MKFEVSDVKSFKTIIDGLSVLVDECGFEFGTEQVTVNALDKSHTTFMSVELDKYYFDEYDCSSPFLAIVDTQQLSKVMKRCKNDDRLIGEITEGKLILTFKGDSDRTFNIILIDNEYESPKPPIIEYPVKVDLPATLFNDSLGDLKILSDVMKISVDEDFLRFTGDGQHGDAEIKYIHGENITKYVESKFSIEKLLEIMKAKDFSETITLLLGDNIPIMIKSELVTGDARLSFLLAPRIGEDDY